MPDLIKAVMNLPKKRRVTVGVICLLAAACRPPIRLTGTLVDASDNRPIDDAGLSFAGHGRGVLRPDSAGRFSFRVWAWDGCVSVVFYRIGYAATEYRLPARRTLTYDLGTVRLEPNWGQFDHPVIGPCSPWHKLQPNSVRAVAVARFVGADGQPLAALPVTARCIYSDRPGDPGALTYEMPYTTDLEGRVVAQFILNRTDARQAEHAGTTRCALRFRDSSGTTEYSLTQLRFNSRLIDVGRVVAHRP